MGMEKRFFRPHMEVNFFAPIAEHVLSVLKECGGANHFRVGRYAVARIYRAARTAGIIWWVQPLSVTAKANHWISKAVE
jgi:hypothetical protein